MTYIPVLILMLVATAIGGGGLFLSPLPAAELQHKRKKIALEGGVPGVGTAHQRFSVRFYLVAILFLLFDVEVVFFFPWAVVYKEYLTINAFILVEMAIFVAILLVGYYYVLRKGALEWE